MWTLILTIYIGTSVSVTSVPYFESEKICKDTGAIWKDQLRVGLANVTYVCAPTVR